MSSNIGARTAIQQNGREIEREGERERVGETVSADRALSCPDLTLLLRPGPIDLKFCTSSGRARQLYELDRCRTASEVPTLTATLHLTTPPLYAYNEMGGRNPITKLASGFPGAYGAGSSSMPFI